MQILKNNILTKTYYRFTISVFLILLNINYNKIFLLKLNYLNKIIYKFLIHNINYVNLTNFHNYKIIF